MASRKMLTARGKTQSMSEWAREFGIPENTFYYWCKAADYNVENALIRAEQRKKSSKTHPNTNMKTLTANGETHTFWDWAKINGINVRTIYSRYERGMTPEQCVNPQMYDTAYLKNRPLYGANGSRQEKLDAERAFVEKQKKIMDKRIEYMNGVRETVKVRWCDRTSHSHTWRDTMVAVSDLYEFGQKHYLAKVVG